MKLRFVPFVLLIPLLLSCGKLPENDTVEEYPRTLTIQTEKQNYTGTLTTCENTRTWQITEPECIAGVRLTCTDTDCTLSVGDVTIPLDDKTADHVRQMLWSEK